MIQALDMSENANYQIRKKLNNAGPIVQKHFCGPGRAERNIAGRAGPGSKNFCGPGRAGQKKNIAGRAGPGLPV